MEFFLGQAEDLFAPHEVVSDRANVCQYQQWCEVGQHQGYVQKITDLFPACLRAGGQYSWIAEDPMDDPKEW